VDLALPSQGRCRRFLAGEELRSYRPRPVRPDQYRLKGSRHPEAPRRRLDAWAAPQKRRQGLRAGYQSYFERQKPGWGHQRRSTVARVIASREWP